MKGCYRIERHCSSGYHGQSASFLPRDQVFSFTSRLLFIMFVSENPVGKQIEHDFSGRFSGKISLSNGTPAKVVLFSGSEYSKEPSLIPVSGFLR